MLHVFCLRKSVSAFLKVPSVSESRRGAARRSKSGRKANWEKFCVLGLAAAQLTLTCLISRVFKSLSPAFRGRTPPQYPWLKCNRRSQCKAKLAMPHLRGVKLITQRRCQCHRSVRCKSPAMAECNLLFCPIYIHFHSKAGGDLMI